MFLESNHFQPGAWVAILQAQSRSGAAASSLHLRAALKEDEEALPAHFSLVPTALLPMTSASTRAA